LTRGKEEVEDVREEEGETRSVDDMERSWYK
jgi:hypothetical protein